METFQKLIKSIKENDLEKADLIEIHEAAIKYLENLKKYDIERNNRINAQYFT